MDCNFFHYAAIILKISDKGDTLKDFVIIRDYWGVILFLGIRNG